MKITIVATVIVFFIGSAMEAKKLLGPIPNNLIFEKMEYRIFNKTLIKDGIIKWKKVAYNTVIFNASATITEPLNEIWVHIVLYYKYRQYQKYLVDIWVEYCRAIHNPNTHPVVPLAFKNYFLLREYFYINFDQECPISGEVQLRTIDKFNVSKINVPLMQAGRYRANFYFSVRQNGPVYASGELYGSISDIRVWF